MPQGQTLLDEVAGQGGATLLDEVAGPEPAPQPSFLQSLAGVPEAAVRGAELGLGTALTATDRMLTAGAQKLGLDLPNAPGESTLAGLGGALTKFATEQHPEPQGVMQTFASGVGQVAIPLVNPETAIPYFGALSAGSIQSTYDQTLAKTKDPTKAWEAALLSVPVEAAQFYGPLKAVGKAGAPAGWAKAVAEVFSKLSPKAQGVAVKLIEGAANGAIGAGAASVGRDAIASELGGEDIKVLDAAANAAKAAGYGAAIVGLLGGAHALAEGAPASGERPASVRQPSGERPAEAAPAEPQPGAPEEFRYEGDQVPEAVPGTPEPARERSPEEIQGALDAARAESEIPAGMEAVPRILRVPGATEPRAERPAPRFIQPPREAIQRAAADPDLKAAAVEFEKASQRRKLDLREQLQDNLHEFLTPEDIKDIADWTPGQAPGATEPVQPTISGPGTEPLAKSGETSQGLPSLPAEAKRLPHTETPEFKAWFGESKVTDEDGKPLVVYHGTNRDFTRFERAPSKTGNVTAGLGYFFSPSGGEASRYASDFGTKEGGAVLPTFLSIRNPYPMSYSEWNEIAMRPFKAAAEPAVGMKTAMAPERMERIRKADEAAKQYVSELRAKLISEGYDGIQIHNGAMREYVAFYPEQIKSAIGNSGRFDPTSPDLRDRPAPPPQEPAAAPSEAKAPEPPAAAPSEPAKAQAAGPEPELATSIKDAQLEADRVRYGLPPVVKEAAREFGPEWESVGRKMEEDPSIVSRVMADEHVPGLEKHERQIVAMREKIAAENEWERIKQAQDDAATAKDPAREAELRPLAAAATDRLDAAIGAAQREISASGRGLSFVRLMARHDFSLAALERQERISSGGKPLTDVQRSEIRALHDELAKLESDFEAFRARREQALSERAKRTIEASPEKKARVLSFLDAEADAARARLKSKLHRAGGGFPIDPEMVLDLAKIAASHIAHGIDAGVQLVKDFGEDIRPHLQEILAKAATLKDKSNRREAALNARPKRMQRTLEKLEAKEASGQVGPEPKPERVPLNPEEQKIQAQIERVRTRIRQRFLANEAARRSPIEKVQDTLVKWRRGFVLSSPTVFAKLTSAALERMGTTATEEAVGKVLGKGMSRLAERAPREGGASVRIEAEALAEGFTKGMADSWQTLKTGKSDLDAAFGKEGGLPPEAIDFLGTIHSALKAPAKRNEFTRAFAKRAEHAIRNGLDTTDPTVQQRIALDAYKDANRSIFLQDNRVVDAYKRGIAALEAPNKETGKPNPYGKAGATVAKVLLPIVKVPTNIVAETFQYALGAPVGGVEAINAYRRGIETLSPVEADAIMRHLKKGSIGAALMLLGYFRADQIGGYYTGKRDEKDVKPGGLRLFGWNVPAMLVHNPALETLQIGATVRRVADSKLRKSDAEEQGIGAGTVAAALGLIEEVPFVREAYEMADLKDPASRGRVVGQTVGSLVVPGAVSWIARQIDEDEKGETVRRDPKTINDYIKAGIPGLRQSIPEKSTPRPRRSLSLR